MKKQLILSLALMVSIFSFAQNKELRVLEKAVKNNNYAEAKTVVSELEPMLSSMDDKSKAKFYLNKGKAFFANGAGSAQEVMVAVESLDSISGNSYAGEVADLKKLMENDLLQKANTLFTNKNFKEAEMAFANLFEVVPTDAEYLYYAAVSAVSGQDYDAALKHYLKLREIGYTGVKMEYFAVNKETGEEEVMDKETRDLYVKTIKSHITPGVRETESKVPEITKNIAFIYLQQNKTEEALAAIKEARVIDPDNSDLIITEANIQYKLGNTEEYERLIKEATTKDPNNIDLLFNLGVLSATSGKIEDAKKYYLKVISLDSKNVNALTNLAVLILDEDKAIVEEMNALGNSNADNQRYDELIAKRQTVYKEAIPYLEVVVSAGKADADVARTLMNIYSAVGEASKAKEIKVKFNL